MVLKGSFVVKFSASNSDSFDATFDMSVPVAEIANAKVSINLGSGASSTILQDFTTDEKGNYFDSGKGLQFSINPKKHLVRLKVGKAGLRTALNLENKTVVNGTVDVPVTITITGASGTSALASRLRFVYNAKVNVSGAGKSPRSGNY